MNHIANKVTLPLFFFICLSFFPLLNAINVDDNAKTDLVARTCKQVKLKDLCLSSLRQEPDSKSATNDKDIALLAVKNAERQCNDNSGWLTNTLNDKVPPKNKEVYQRCANYYESAMKKLVDVVVPIKQGRYETAKGELTVATSEAMNCVTEAKAQHASFENNDKFHQLCQLATEIVTAMNPNQNPT